MSALIIVGRSCSGKSTLQNELLLKEGYEKCVTCTTRDKRKGEIDGVHYHFLSKESFLQNVKEGKFVEWVEYVGNFYGTLREDLNGRSIKVIVLEPQGAYSVKKQLGNEALVVFLRVDSQTAENAFRNRGDDEGITKSRLQEDEVVFKDVSEFADVIIDNSGFKLSSKEVATLVDTVVKSVF